MGYIPSIRESRGASGPAFALGARVFTGGRRHRGFLEGAFCPVGVETAPVGSGTQGDAILFGPSLSLGYQFVGSSGVTFEVSAGIGRSLTGPDDAQDTFPISTIAVGYTWRAREKQR